jgi:hypothetical protein
LLEVKVIVVGLFADHPNVEEFFHHKKTELVAQVEKFRRRQIVRRLNRVDAQRFKLAQTGFIHRSRDRNAHQSQAGRRQTEGKDEPGQK